MYDARTISAVTNTYQWTFIALSCFGLGKFTRFQKLPKQASINAFYYVFERFLLGRKADIPAHMPQRESFRLQNYYIFLN